MKPADILVARKGDYTLDPAVPLPEARALIIEHHYAKGCSRTATDVQGIRKDGVLVGAAWWLPPTRVAAESVCGPEWERVVALSRLVVHPDEPQNAASILLGYAMRCMARRLVTADEAARSILPKPVRANGTQRIGRTFTVGERRWHGLVTYADTFRGHTGQIYKATNWIAKGVSSKTVRWEDDQGRQMASQSTITRTSAEMVALGYHRVGSFDKIKFVHFTEPCGHPTGKCTD